MIDTHTHIYLPEFENDRELIITKARENGIKHLILPNVDTETIDALHQSLSSYPDYCSAAMGLHPTSVATDYKKELAVIEENLSEKKYCAIGEIGIDLYWDQTHIKEQSAVFETQLQWASEMNLPVIIHSRDSFAEIFAILRRNRHLSLTGVFHSFTGDENHIREINDLGNFYFGINGIVTFKKSTIKTVVPLIGADRLLLETDAPYLAPVPYRGKRNEPSYLKETAVCLAEILQLELPELDRLTTANAKKVFNLETLLDS